MPHSAVVFRGFLFVKCIYKYSLISKIIKVSKFEVLPHLMTNKDSIITYDYVFENHSSTMIFSEHCFLVQYVLSISINLKGSYYGINGQFSARICTLLELTM